jgi:hypothetical protein
MHLLLRFLRTQNDKGKKYKPLFQTFVGRQIVRHDKNSLARILTTIGDVSWKPSDDNPSRTFLGSLANCGSKWSRACQASPFTTRNIISEFSLSHFPSLCHLVYVAVFPDSNNHSSFGVIGM